MDTVIFLLSELIFIVIISIQQKMKRLDTVLYCLFTGSPVKLINQYCYYCYYYYC